MNKCLHCSKNTANPKFCSRNCAATINNKIPKRVIKKQCTRCDNKVRNYKSNLCETHFFQYQQSKRENLENRTLKDYINRDCIKNQHLSSKYSHIRGLARSWHKDLVNKPCHICGYNKHVELAHIKPLSSFSLDSTIGEVNHIKNVIQLCPNCHWEFDKKMIEIS